MILTWKYSLLCESKIPFTFTENLCASSGNIRFIKSETAAVWTSDVVCDLICPNWFWKSKMFTFWRVIS